jgi:hypothetical protein
VSNNPWTPAQQDYLAQMLKTIATTTGMTVRERIDKMVDESQTSLDEAFEAVKGYVDRSIDALWEEVKALKDRPEFSDAGIWVHDKTYKTGNGVSESGSFWIAKRDTTFGEKPGASDAWRLAVKRGKDGRDAR